MFKTAVDRSEELLNNPPTREEASVSEYVKNLKQAKRDLQAELNDPRTRMGDRDVVKIARTIAEIDEKLPTAEAILEAIRNEIPQEQMVEGTADGAIDVKASVEKLAVAYAAQTIGVNNWTRLADGIAAFEEHLEPLLEPEYKDFAARKYQERLAELISMSPQKLAEEQKKTFPKDEWIGKDPEPVGGEGDLGYIPSHFEKDPTTEPEKKDIDGEFEKAIDKERKFRGIEKAEGTAGDKVEKKSSVTADATRSNDNLATPAQSADGGAQMQAKPPEPEEAFEKTIEEEANKSTGAPRGPNRRTQKDVPAYSTPREKLTAALKLTEMFENMSAEEALRIVDAAVEDEDAKEENEDSHEVHKEASYNESLEGLFDV